MSRKTHSDAETETIENVEKEVQPKTEKESKKLIVGLKIRSRVRAGEGGPDPTC